jgi:hypothetical protein
MGDADELDGYEPDKLSEWSERKIAIVSKYAVAYSIVLAGHRLKHFYIDGFAGGPIALRKETGEQIATTARRFLEIEPAFAGYHVVDADAGKVSANDGGLRGPSAGAGGTAMMRSNSCNSPFLLQSVPKQATMSVASIASSRTSSRFARTSAW